MSRGRFPEYIPVRERRERAAAAAKKLGTRGIPAGAVLGATFWSKAWNRNLESYADFYSRLERGRSYVRNGHVIDLKIETGNVKSKVSGSRSQPYAIEVKIDRASAVAVGKMRKALSGKVENVEQIFEGKFPTDLAELLVAKGSGLFPAPEGIHFACNCPDWAGMCKHVAATLYGIGIRFDGDPGLFFKLRGIDIESELAGLVGREVKKLLHPEKPTKSKQKAKSANAKSAKTVAGKPKAKALELSDAALRELFGI